ncbi:MAG: DUF3329 domain-containing protein [Rhizobiaceae bacterium]|nr:DUF3329 domain-containing protein [Rhizobiaceae bacterium]
MNDREHPFFRPLWRRILLVVFCACWAAWEIYNGERFWAYLTLGITAYGAWVFLFTYNRPTAKTATQTPDEKE